MGSSVLDISSHLINVAVYPWKTAGIPFCWINFKATCNAEDGAASPAVVLSSNKYEQIITIL